MATFGIHTCVPDKSQPDRTHAWVTIESNGQTRGYSLYPDEHYRANLNGQSQGWNQSGTHVREGVDADQTPTQSRYTEITKSQEADFYSFLNEGQTWTTFSNNCSHFASNAWERTTGENLGNQHGFKSPDSDKILPVASPVGLEQSIAIRNNAASQQALAAATTIKEQPELNPQQSDDKSLAELKAELKASLKEDRPPPPPPPPPPTQASGYTA